MENKKLIRTGVFVFGGVILAYFLTRKPKYKVDKVTINQEDGVNTSKEVYLTIGGKKIKMDLDANSKEGVEVNYPLYQVRVKTSKIADASNLPSGLEIKITNKLTGSIDKNLVTV